MRRAEVLWWGSVLVLATVLPAAAGPTGEVTRGGGQIEAHYQPGGLGDLDDYWFHVAGEVGFSEELGAGLSVSRGYGTDDLGADVDTTFGELYIKYQFMERRRPQDFSVAALGGYRMVRERGTTLSGFSVAAVGELPFSPQAALQARVGFGFFEDNTMVDFWLGAGYEVVRGLRLEAALQTFIVDSVTEGGLMLGLSYRFGGGGQETGGDYW